MPDIKEFTNRELYLLVDEGFKSTHRRLDKTNGNIIKNDNRITKLETWKFKLIGAFIVTNIIFLPTIFILIKKCL